MRKTTLYIGLNDKDSKMPVMDVLPARDLVARLLLNAGIGGATISEAVGIYTHENGAGVVIEKTIRAELLDTPAEKIKMAVADIKKTLNQESVLVENTTIQADFV